MKELPSVTVGAIKENAPPPDWRKANDEDEDDEDIAIPDWVIELLGFDPSKEGDDSLRADASWEEAKHPRGPDGKFVSIGGSGAKPESKSGWTEVGGTKQGYTQGGIMKNPEGEEFYVKYPSPAAGKVEALAGELTNQMGIKTVNPQFQITNGKESVVSKLDKNLKQLVLSDLTDPSKLSSQQQKQLAAIFAGAVLNNNWDAIGGEGGMPINIMMDKEGNLVQLDLGGSLDKKGVGTDKPFNDDFYTTWYAMQNPQFSSGKVFSQLFNTRPNLYHDVENALLKLDSDNVQWAFKQSGLDNAEKLYNDYVARRHSMLEYAQEQALASEPSPSAKAAEEEPEPEPPKPPPPTPAEVKAAEPPKPAEPNPLKPGWAEDKIYGKTYQLSPQFLSLQHQFLEAKKGYEANPTPGSQAYNHYIKMREKLKKLSPPGYFDAKFKNKKAWQVKLVPSPPSGGATPAPAAVKPAPQPLTPPAATPAQPFKVSPGVMTFNEVKQQALPQLGATIGSLENLLQSEAMMEHTHSPTAYAPKLSKAKEDFGKMYTVVGQLANKYAQNPSPQNKAFYEAAADFAGKYDFFLQTKTTIAQAKANNTVTPELKAEAKDAKAKLEVAKASLEVQLKGAGISTAPGSGGAPAAPQSTGTSVVGGHYPGFKRYQSMAEHNQLGVDMKQRKLDSLEQSALTSYKGAGYDDINGQLRAGKKITPHTAQKIVQLDRASRAGTVPKNTVLYRGVGNWQQMGWQSPLDMVKSGDWQYDPGFISTSSSDTFAANWAKNHGSKPILMEMRITREMKGCHVDKGRGQYNADGEQEIVMPRGTMWKCVGHRRQKYTSYGGTHEIDVVTMEPEEYGEVS